MDKYDDLRIKIKTIDELIKYNEIEGKNYTFYYDERLAQYVINPNLDLFKMTKKEIEDNNLEDTLALYLKVDLPQLKQTLWINLKE